MSDAHTPWYRRLLQCIVEYCLECFGKAFFVVFFIGTALNQVSTACRNMFNPLFATEELGLNEEQFGHIMGIGSLCSIGAMLLAGYLIDKWHPLRVYILTGFIIIFLNFFGYFFVVDFSTFMIVGILVVIIYSLQNLTGLPMMVALMPEERFGQFASANSLVNCLLMILANAEGVFEDMQSPLDCYIMTLGNTQQMGVVLATQLRAAGYRVEMNFGKRSMKSQFKSVERFNASTVLIVGEDEIANNTVTLKRVKDQLQVSIPMDQLVETMYEWLMDTEEHHHE